jgi:histidinol phosphatase-like PHP family hydrolase
MGAVEIDGDPAREDFDYEVARQALGAGCVFALNSDVCISGQLPYAEARLPTQESQVFPQTAS